MDKLGINGWQLAVQLVAFIVFVYLLWRFAVGPIVRVLDQRAERIRESMASAERMQAELKETQARNEDALIQARREAQEIVASARQTGEQMIANARTEAAAQQEEYLKRAEDTLRQQTEEARVALRKEVGDLAVLAAGRIVRKELDPATQAQLIEQTLADASRVSRN